MDHNDLKLRRGAIGPHYRNILAVLISLQRCSICRSLLDPEDLFCSNCGTECPSTDTVSLAPQQQASLHSFRCESCGASMSYDASAQALRCPFCGSEKMSSQKDSRTLKPNGVVAFQTDRSQVEQILRQWLSKGFWRPGDASQAASIRDVTQVYVPFWIFSAKTSTNWTADCSPAPPSARGEWYPRGGTHEGQYEGLLVGASSTLTPSEVDSIAPFQLEPSFAPDQIDLTNSIVEEFRMPRKHARPLAQGLLESEEAAACQQYLPGRSRNMKVNVRIQEMRGEPLLLPIWIMVYRYKDQPYRVLINGQTGKIAGAAPFSYSKLTAVLAIIVVFMIALFVIAMLAAQFSRS